jgi:hypothetical protein
MNVIFVAEGQPNPCGNPESRSPMYRSTSGAARVPESYPLLYAPCRIHPSRSNPMGVPGLTSPLRSTGLCEGRDHRAPTDSVPVAQLFAHRSDDREIDPRSPTHIRQIRGRTQGPLRSSALAGNGVRVARGAQSRESSRHAPELGSSKIARGRLTARRPHTPRVLPHSRGPIRALWQGGG